MEVIRIIERHGYRLQDISKKLKMKPSTLEGTISGNPTVGTLRKVAEAVGCPVAEFFFDELPEDYKFPAIESAVQQTFDEQGGTSDLPFDNQPEQQAQQESPVGTALVGLVRCPQCGRAIRLFAEE